jgi:hypothetical protein
MISVLGLVGWLSSIILALAHYFEEGTMVAVVAMLIVCFYTISVPAARNVSPLRTDQEKIADVRASATGAGLPLILVWVSLLAAIALDRRGAPVILPAAFLHTAFWILVTPIFTIPFLIRVWRKDPNRS